MLSRRRFVTGLTASALAGASVRRRAFAQAPPEAPAVLSGKHIALSVGAVPYNVTGRPRTATAVNGSVPGPILRLREGDTVQIDVSNQLREPTSIHWHGIRLPADQDGVPGLSFRGIAPGETFSYRFTLRQAGTYWYHSHSGMQEQTGLYGPLIIEPRAGQARGDRDYTVLLSDWSDADPMAVLSNLKQQSDYYNYHRRTLGTFVEDARRDGFAATLRERLMWGRMRMSPTDIMDVTGATYTFLVNGRPPAANWTALYTPGETVRLRFINGSSMTTFDVRIPGLPLQIVSADGADIEPLTVDEFRVGVAETYDVLVQPDAGLAYTLFAQAQDRSGYARATLAPRTGLSATVPALDPPPVRTMDDMGMMAAHNRLADAGDGLDGNGRRVLRYSDLRALESDSHARAPERELVFHLTGNMQRYVWGFDGRKFSEAGPVRVRLGERVRFVLVNDTMMEHPVHLHGFLFALENGQDDHLPLKHTINVKPNERLSFVFNADTPGYWAFHCHLAYHMESGMFRTVIVA